jgi:LPS-assembly lipoprotein
MLSSSPKLRVSRRLALLAGLALAACGFEPVYAPGGAALALRDQVLVESGTAPFDYRLRTALEDRLGPTGSPVFRLVVASTVDEVTAAVAPDGSITRFNLTGTATWTLGVVQGGPALASGQVSSFTSYSTTGSTVATRAAENDARDRLAIALADLILARLIVAAQGL